LLSQSRFVLEIVNQASFYACVLREISVPTELALGHLRCRVTDMPPQPNSPSGRCLETRLSSRPKATRLVQLSARLGPHEATEAARTERPPKETNGASRESGKPPIIPNLDGAQPGDYADHWSLHSISEATFQVVVFHLRVLPPILHLRCRRTEPDWSQTQQGLLSPLSPSSPFP